jgi:Trp operon repressor
MNSYETKFDPDFPELINAYRKNIRLKYDLKRIEKYPQFSHLRKDRIELMVSYFLELLYPPIQERIELDSAFASLKGFVHNPSKVFGLIGSLGISLWRIGRYLPQAFSSGLAALSSYLTAHNFEKILLDGAKKMWAQGLDIKEEENFMKLLSLIPKSQADQFREDIVSLFRTLSNEELVDRIILIMESIIQKMIQKKKIYTEEDILGIQLGLGILKKGRLILDSLSKDEKELFVKAIDQIEKDYFESCLEFRIVNQ